MRIIELMVLDMENKELGVDAISLVTEPAIEENFYFFGAEEFVKPHEGESQQDYISRCIPIVVGEGKDASQAAAICYSYWKQEKMGADTSSLPPYVDQTGETRKKRKKMVEIVKQAMAETDNEKDLVVGATYLALVEENKAPYDWTINYRYDGPGPERTFCDHYWQQELNIAEIFAMDFANPGFGIGGNDSYDKFLFKGGPNCKHYWTPASVTMFFVGQDPVTVPFDEMKHRALLYEELFLYGYSSSDFETARTPMFDMSNHGYISKKFNKQRSYAFVNEDQRIVAGPIMIPDMKILRKDDSTDMFYQVYFTKETIKLLSEKYMRDLKINNSNEQHNPTKPVDITMLESWIIDDPKHDKSNSFGFELPQGTWFGTFRINNDETWKKVKDGTFKGFSIEGNFQEKVVQS